jgi:hypothetical protein
MSPSTGSPALEGKVPYLNVVDWRVVAYVSADAESGRWICIRSDTEQCLAARICDVDTRNGDCRIDCQHFTLVARFHSGPTLHLD